MFFSFSEHIATLHFRSYITHVTENLPPSENLNQKHLQETVARPTKPCKLPLLCCHLLVPVGAFIRCCTLNMSCQLNYILIQAHSWYTTVCGLNSQTSGISSRESNTQGKLNICRIFNLIKHRQHINKRSVDIRYVFILIL